MELKIKNMKEFNGLFFFELVIDDVLGVRGFKIARDINGDYELQLPQYKGKKGIWIDSSILYDENFYDKILDLALVELSKIVGSNEVIK